MTNPVQAPKCGVGVYWLHGPLVAVFVSVVVFFVCWFVEGGFVVVCVGVCFFFGWGKGRKRGMMVSAVQLQHSTQGTSSCGNKDLSI